MSKKTIAFISLIAVILLIIYLIWPSDESRIKKLFKEGAHAIEKEDLDSVMSRVSYNYRDEYGLTYLYLKELMKSVFKQTESIKIEYEDVRITISDDTAVTDIDVLVLATVGNNTGYILGDLSEPAHLTFTLEKERTKWLVTKTEGLPFNF